MALASAAGGVLPRRVRVFRAPDRVWRRGLSARMRRTRRALMGIVALGIVLCLAAYPSWGIVYDGAEYAAMGQSLLLHGEFLRPRVEGVVYYRHYGPLFPAYLAAFYVVLGFGVGPEGPGLSHFRRGGEIGQGRRPSLGTWRCEGLGPADRTRGTL